jgi:CBS domain containing-hemolysin-like protein
VVDGGFRHMRGILYMSNVVPLNSAFKTVADAMDTKIYYVAQDQALDQAIHAFLQTKRHFFMVIDKDGKIVGTVNMENIIEAVLGRKVERDFDQYEDPEAVACL